MRKEYLVLVWLNLAKFWEEFLCVQLQCMNLHKMFRSKSFKLVIGVLVNWYISRGNFLALIAVEMCKSTRIPRDYSNESCFVDNFPKWWSEWHNLITITKKKNHTHRPPGNFTLRKLYFHFLPNRMGYDRCDSFPFDFLTQMEFHLVQKIERETVTTIISHSIWKEMEI